MLLRIPICIAEQVRMELGTRKCRTTRHSGRFQAVVVTRCATRARAQVSKTAFLPDRGSMDPRACAQALGVYGAGTGGCFWGPFAFLNTSADGGAGGSAAMMP